MAISSGELKRGFICLSPGIAEKDTISKGGITQLFCQNDCRLGRHDVRSVPQPAGLLRKCGDQRRVRVTQRIDSNTTSKVEIFCTGLVPDSRTTTSNRNHITRRIVRHHDLIVGFACGCGHSHSPSILFVSVFDRIFYPRAAFDLAVLFQLNTKQI